MSVRKVKQKDRKGRVMEFWMIDVKLHAPDGRSERIRRVARIQNKREAEKEEREVIAAFFNDTPITSKEVTPPNTSTSTIPAPTAPVAPTVPLFKDFAKTFLETYAATNNKPAEVDTKESVLRMHLVPAFGTLRLDEIGIEQIEGFKATTLKKKLSPKSVNNHLTILRKLLVVANEWGKLAHVPRVRWLKVPEPEVRFLDFDDAKTLIAHAAPEWRAMVTVAARTGLRLGELFALRWCDVDLANGRLVVRRSASRGRVGTPKSGRSREVPLSQEALDALKGHRHLRGELVFCAEKGRMLRKNEAKWPLWSACKRAGIERIGWHVLRHTFASHLTMRGAPLKSVQELLGHSTIEMTMRYAHLSPDARRDAVRLLDDASLPGHGKTGAKQSEEGKAG